MPSHDPTLYEFQDLLHPDSFRVIELLPGKDNDPVSCLIHDAEWSEVREYEAVSYAWGDPANKRPVICKGKRIDVTKNLYDGLTHLRFEDRSRVLWADALCINQSNVHERNLQVRQMKKIYRSAKAVLIWLGPDTQDSQAETAVDAILTISEFLCQTLHISANELSSIGNIYHELVFKNRDLLPSPNECSFSNASVWKSLKWLYSHPYFTRVWVIQEVSANKERIVHFGDCKAIWDRVDLVAGFIMVKSPFFEKFEFSTTYCWWLTSITELSRQPQDWLCMLYLASNYSTMDPREVIYGLKGLMKFLRGNELLDPDYSKSKIEVYRDTVEASFLNFNDTNVLLYVNGNEDPSWIPRWNQAMVFRNPFRFGAIPSWRPCGAREPKWHIDKSSNILHISGFIVDSIRTVNFYNEKHFSGKAVKPQEQTSKLKKAWRGIIDTMKTINPDERLTKQILMAAAVSFSFGLDHNTHVGTERRLLKNFLAYLRCIVDEETYHSSMPQELERDSFDGDADQFGKPVWDFQYPESSFFITQNNWIGCVTSTTTPGDVVCVPFGCRYPLVLRPTNGDCFQIRGFAYVHGIMYGECKNAKERNFKIC